MKEKERERDELRSADTEKSKGNNGEQMREALYQPDLYHWLIRQLDEVTRLSVTLNGHVRLIMFT